jgi:hypothetical protein
MLWGFLAIGAAVGLTVGILVAAATDVPFAPEIGLVVGGGVAWALRLVLARSGTG